MEKFLRTFSIVLFTLNILLAAFITWHQIAMFFQGRRLGISERPPVLFIFIIAGLVTISGLILVKGKRSMAALAGVGLTLLLLPLSLILLAGVGM